MAHFYAIWGANIFETFCDTFILPKTLSISDSKQKLRYAEMLLAYSLRLPDNQRISKTSMKQAAGVALGKLMLKNDIAVPAKNPNYSNKFRRRLKDIKAAQYYNGSLSLRRIGIAIVAAIIAFAMTITASAELRARFFDWLVETFPLFSQFGAASTVEPSSSDFERLQNMKLIYIPSGYTLVDTFEADPMIVYRYEDSSGNILSVNARTPTGSPILFDTENTKINEIMYNDQTAYWWYRDGICYFIWQQEGFELNIFGQVSYEKIIKIADNIQI